MVKSYIHSNDGQVICQKDGSQSATKYFYVTDRLGSVRQLIDSAGAVKRFYAYSPFGQLLETGSTQNAPSNPFLFTGQWFDSEIGQYYLRARMYDPQLMRFTSRDPVNGKYEEPMSFHRYLYCWNDPVNATDPTGHILDLLLGLTEGENYEAKSAVVAAGVMWQAKEVFALATIAGLATYFVAEAIWQDNNHLIDKAVDFSNLVCQQALNKYDEMKGGKQKYRDKDLFQFKKYFKGDPDKWRKFRRYVEQIMGKKGRDATKVELKDLFDEFMNGGY